MLVHIMLEGLLTSARKGIFHCKWDEDYCDFVD